MTTERKNYYEELVDKLIIDEVSGLDNEIRETLENLDTKQKRLAILSILDKDRRLFMDIKKLVDGNNVSATEHIKEVVQMLRKYVEVGDVEVKKFGEVMTPIFLVEDMLDTLPSDVWSNPDLKWLDPANGCGIFSSIAIQRLMEGLREFEPCEEKRYRHIVENMIYVCELQSRNMFLHLCAFDSQDIYELNIYTGSYLDEGFDRHKKEVWGVESFNCIMMNPPYQWKREGERKSHTLWEKFVEKVISYDLKEEGYLVAVHPDGWRNVSGRFKKVQKLLTNRAILSLNMNGAKKGKETFGASTTYDFYCLKNSLNTNIKTRVVDRNDKIELINLNGVEFIPNVNISRVFSFIAKGDEQTVEILNSHTAYEHRKKWMSKEQSDLFRFPCIQNVNVKNKPSCIWYSTTNKNGHFGLPKVIFGRRGSGVFIDSDGNYGMAEDCSAIIDEFNNLENIKKALENEKFIKEIMGFDGLADKYNRKIISTFRKDFWKEFID